jgi:hypothetical protein
MDIFNTIENITIKNTTSTLTEHLDYELEFLEDGQLEIEIRNVSLTRTGIEWYNITLEFYDLGLREVEALEGIENKTGTFHLDVNCPSEGEIGNDMTCIITAYVEDSQIIQKEVDFTCNIIDGDLEYSSVNYNQMITRNPVSVSREFAIPSTFNDEQQYILQCYADYYNLGSRRDSFYDTFTASTIITTQEGGGSSGESEASNETSTEEESLITGEIVGETEEGIIPTIFTTPFSSPFIIIFLTLIILLLIILLIKRIKHKKEFYVERTDWRRILTKVGLILLVLILIGGLFIGGIYGFKFIKENNSQKSASEETISSQESTSYSIIQDNLFRGIILATFIIIAIIVLFRLLNIRGEIRFGYDYMTKNCIENKKNARLEKRELKEEIEKEKDRIKNSYKTKRMPANEFYRTLNRIENEL